MRTSSPGCSSNLNLFFLNYGENGSKHQLKQRSYNGRKGEDIELFQMQSLAKKRKVGGCEVVPYGGVG